MDIGGRSSIFFSRILLLQTVLISAAHITVSGSSWSEWWSYEGISGPEFWGLVNPEWSLCSKGKRQSPVDIDPETILYDPRLQPLTIDRHPIGATLVNTGHDISLMVEHSSSSYVNISGGPLSYQYRVVQVVIHFGSVDETGSEHTINGTHFPAEIQIIGYNAELHSNLSQALHSTNGLAIVSLLGKIDNRQPNDEFDNIVRNLETIRFKGQEAYLRHLSVSAMLPQTDDYVTYEGSLSQPGCMETVTWVIFNKPIYISSQHLSALRLQMQGDINHHKFPIQNNFRPTMPLHQRAIRTNIPPNGLQVIDCRLPKKVFYQANFFRS